MLRFPREREGRPECDLINCAAKQPAHHIDAVDREICRGFLLADPLVCRHVVVCFGYAVVGCAAPKQERCSGLPPVVLTGGAINCFESPAVLAPHRTPGTAASTHWAGFEPGDLTVTAGSSRGSTPLAPWHRGCRYPLLANAAIPPRASPRSRALRERGHPLVAARPHPGTALRRNRHLERCDRRWWRSPARCSRPGYRRRRALENQRGHAVQRYSHASASRMPVIKPSKMTLSPADHG
jgi:hypothetical protein